MKAILLIASLLFTLNASAFELLVKAVDATNKVEWKDRAGCYKRGMPVVIKPDGWNWGTEETLPKFVVIKVPLVSVDKATHFIAQQMDTNSVLFRRRLWQIQWADLPAAARTKLANNGGLVIKASASYTNSYDYTWTQIKAYFKRLDDNTTAGDL